MAAGVSFDNLAPRSGVMRKNLPLRHSHNNTIAL
jgi:hypothetical protein